MPSTEIYTLSLHDALPISYLTAQGNNTYTVRTYIRKLFKKIFKISRHSWLAIIPTRFQSMERYYGGNRKSEPPGFNSQTRNYRDRKSTRLNSSHSQISYAVHRDLHSFPTRRSSDLVPYCSR